MAMAAVVLGAMAAPEAMAAAQVAMVVLQATAAAQVAMVALQAMAALAIMAASLTILLQEHKHLGGTATTTRPSLMTGMRKSRMTIIRA